MRKLIGALLVAAALGACGKATTASEEPADASYDAAAPTESMPDPAAPADSAEPSTDAPGYSPPQDAEAPATVP